MTELRLEVGLADQIAYQRMMIKYYGAFTTLIVVLTVFVGCGAVRPTVTLAPSSSAPALNSSTRVSIPSTPLPPTATWVLPTATLKAAATGVPATRTPIPTPTPSAPVAIATPTEAPIPGYDQLIQLFSYDQDAPLDLAVEFEKQQGSAVVQTITYSGGMGFRVPAYLVMPNGGGPYPAVIYLHKGAADKNQYLTEALMLADMGVVSLLLDSPFVRNPYGGELPRDDYPATTREGIIRQVIDVRKGADLLLTMPEVDSTGIGYVGHSLGATFGGIVVGVEPRIKACVLMAGVVQFSTLYFDGPLKPELSPDLDAVHYVGHAPPAAILFQYGQYDLAVHPSEGRAYFYAAGEPKAILWYEADHDSLEWKSREDRLQWLSEQLGFVYQPE